MHLHVLLPQQDAHFLHNLICLARPNSVLHSSLEVGLDRVFFVSFLPEFFYKLVDKVSDIQLLLRARNLDESTVEAPEGEEHLGHCLGYVE